MYIFHKQNKYWGSEQTLLKKENRTPEKKKTNSTLKGWMGGWMSELVNG